MNSKQSEVPQSPCPPPAAFANSSCHQNGNKVQDGCPQGAKQICAEKIQASVPNATERLLTIPAPPRHADGRIDWPKISDEVLAGLLKLFLQSEIAKAWGVTPGAIYQQIVKRKANGRLRGIDREEMFASRLYAKPTKLKLFELLWTMPASHIAERIGCSQATVHGWANDYGLKGPGARPGHRYWQRKKNGIKVVVPPKAKAIYLELRAQTAPGEAVGEIPEVFRTCETAEKPDSSQPEKDKSTAPAASVTTGAADARPLVEASKSNRRRRHRIPLNLSRADFLEQLWLKPTTRLAEEQGMSSGSIIQKAREAGLGPYRPPEKYWRTRKSGDALLIPEHVQKQIAQLRAESDRARESAAASATGSASKLPATAPQTSPVPPMIGSAQLPAELGPSSALDASAKRTHPSPSANA